MREQTYVYFIKAIKSGLIKIGTTSDVKGRLNILQIGSPERLEFLGALRGGFVKEREVHTKFRSCRSHGEWFHPSGELLAFIKELPEFETLRRSKPDPGYQAFRTPGTHTVQEAARILDCTPGYIFNLLWTKRFRGAIKYGRTWSIPASSIFGYQAQQKTRQMQIKSRKIQREFDRKSK